MQTLFGYLIVFVAGYLSAFSWKWSKKKRDKEQHPFIEKIHGAKTSKALLQILIAQDNKNFTSSIEKLESSIYGNTNIHLSRIKKEVLEKII